MERLGVRKIKLEKLGRCTYGITKKVIGLALSVMMLLNIIPFRIFNSKVNAQSENSENEYNFTSPDKDSNGNYVDNGNIKSAEWTSEDKSTADINITYSKPENNILFLGSLCRGHGLTGEILQQEINYLSSLGNVDAHFSGWHGFGADENGLSLYGNEVHRIFHYHINKGETDNTIKNLIANNEAHSNGRHAYLVDYVEWIHEELKNNKKKYELIVFSFDDFVVPMTMSATITGEWYKDENGEWKEDSSRVLELQQKMRKVAELLSSYYTEGKVVWLIGNTGISINNSVFPQNELDKIYINVSKQLATKLEEQREHHANGGYYYKNWPEGNNNISNSSTVYAFIAFPRMLREYNHVLKAYNKTYIENGVEKNLNIDTVLANITGQNINDLTWYSFASTVNNVSFRDNNIQNFVMSQRPPEWQFALYDPSTYLEVTNEDGSFKEIPSLVAEINKDNSGNETAVGIYTDSDKQWNLNTPKTYYGNPEKVGELVGSMLKYHEIKITDTVNEGLVPESLEIQFQNKQDQDGNKDWITFKKIDLENGEGLSETEIPGTVVDLSKNRSYVIKEYRAEKNGDNTYNVCVNVLNKNQETGNAIDIEDNIRLIIHTKADKSFAVENGEENGLTTYGSKDTNKGEATISTTYYKDGNTANTAPENIDTITRVKYTSPKLTKTFKIHYISDENGYVINKGEKTEKNSEEAIVGHNPNGSEAGNNKPFGLTTNTGYKFSHWIADKDVELMDGTKIKAGEAITSDQVKQINVKEEITFKAIHIKTDGAAQEEPKQEDTPKEEPKEENKKQPKTGDSITLWISLMLISTLGVIGTIIYFKKKN